MIFNQLRILKTKKFFDEPIEKSPYSNLINLRLKKEEAGKLITVMGYHDDLIGAPYPPALHGGTIAALLEMAAFFQLGWDLDMERMPKTVDVNIDYLRPGKPKDCYASATVNRIGRRFANIHVTAWQDDPEKPIATARLHFLIVDSAENCGVK